MQVKMQQTPATPEKLRGAREGQAGVNASAVQQSHDGDVIYQRPNGTEAQVGFPLQACQAWTAGLLASEGTLPPGCGSAVGGAGMRASLCTLPQAAAEPW